MLYFKDNLYIIKTLKEFQYVDEDGKDCGANVRQKAKDISNLLSDPSRLKEERRNRASMRDRRGHPSMAEDEEGRRSRAMERNDDELRDAIEAPKQSLAEERRPGERSSTSSVRDNKPSDSFPVRVCHSVTKITALSRCTPGRTWEIRPTRVRGTQRRWKWGSPRGMRSLFSPRSKV